MCKDFVHLHGHTLKSKGDATARPKALVKKAFDMGQKTIAVTDHGVASSWIEMAKACKEVTEDARKKAKEINPNITDAELQAIGIKFIPGVEMYETNDRTIKSKAEMDQFGFSTHHFLMLPKNEEGLKNLNRIISDASWNGQFSGRNRTDMDTIVKNGWGKGIIATSACLASRTSRYILDGRYDEAKAFALKCNIIFDEFYLEVQDNNIKDQYIVNQALIQMSNETGLPLVYTQDYHYVNEDEKDLHDTWICIGRNNEKHDPNRQGYDGGPYHLASNDEMYEAVAQGRIPEEAYTNTVVIADKCNVEINLKLNRFPKYKFVPAGYTAASYLRKKCFDALWEFLSNRPDGDEVDAEEYRKRLDYELDVINGKGYADYFLILDDVFSFCRRNNILTGPGRGSGAGAKVAFLLEITGLDPIKHRLLFERFLNPERASAPDKYLVA